MLYDVILPLAVNGVLTYNMPEQTGSDNPVGKRVLVPLGKKKIYSGIVWRIHTGVLPEGIETKDIIEVLDSHAIVTESQLQLWRWLASYYMCTLGEVMKAALPAALKLESETRICINDIELANQVTDLSLQQLTSTQIRILECLDDGKEKTIDEISRIIGIRSLLPALQKLQELNFVLIGEQVKDRYRPKTVNCLMLADNYKDNEAALQLLLDSLSHAKKQQQLLLLFLHLAQENTFVRRDELLALSGVTPAVLKALIDKEILKQSVLEPEHTHLQSSDSKLPATLNSLQLHAKEQIHRLWYEKDVVLLHGVTGSGKTEIYIHLIQEAIQNGRQVLYLVPEIALTTQLTERLQAVFGSRLAVYHSRLSDRERAEIYHNLLETDRYGVVLGVRSSLFLPLQRLGLIIVDEEHDASYKQQDPAPRYHAGNAAVWLAKQTGAKVLLGTATPAVETYYNALRGKFGLVELAQRHGNIQLPDISIVDTRLQYHRKEMTGHFSDPLVLRMRAALAQHKQVIVFQNRRGYAPWVECNQCAYVPKCVNCDVSMTLHKRQGTLVCHYCGYTIPLPSVCPACGQPTLSDHGMGTEKIEDELHELMPEARVTRMDFDTTRNRHAYQRIIDDFAAHKTDILVGTQMVSKGLHFDDVSTVAVLSADSLFNQPDFRSSERAYQMLEQVSGRAGRKEMQGEVVIQTANPDNVAIRYVADHDYKSMYEEQIREREAFRYPPFFRILVVTVKHREALKASLIAAMLQGKLHTVFTRRCSRVVEPVISKVQNMYIRNIILKIETSAPYDKAKELLRQQIEVVRQNSDAKGAVIFVDVDPL